MGTGKTGCSVNISMACTFGPVDSGIVKELADQYYDLAGVRVQYVAAGTGKVIEMSKTGDYDIVMVHAKALEEQFVADGFGTERIDLMYNDFVIVGPENDPAGIRGTEPVQAFDKIRETGSRFVSRGDNSGTHVKEKELWEKTGSAPRGDWYDPWEGGNEGSAITLKYADRRQAYMFVDRATYLTLKKKVSLVVLVEGHKLLLNFITLIPVNPKKLPQVKYKEAMEFVDFMTSEKAQTTVRDFGTDAYGEPLFFPNSSRWKEKN